MMLQGRFQNLIHRPSPKPTSPILFRLSNLEGIPPLLQLALNQIKSQPEDSDTELLKRWLIWITLEHSLPGFAKSFVSDNDCILLLLHSLGLETTVSADLTSDPSAATINAISCVLNDDDLNTISIRRQAVFHGTLDRMLLRLGELQAEEPRRQTRTKMFQAGDPTPPPPPPVPPVPLEPIEESRRHLWRPGYGTGEATSTRNDGKREQIQKQKLERTITTVKSLSLFLQPINCPPEDPLWSEILDCIDASCLLRVLTACFFGVTVKVVVPQAALFEALLEFVICLASKPALSPLLGDVQGMFKSVRDLVDGMKDLCDDLQDDDPNEFALVSNLPNLIHRALNAMAVSTPIVAKPLEPHLSYVGDENAFYMEIMGPELFRDRDMRDPQGGYSGHHFAQLIDDDIRGKISNTRHRRLHRELKAIRKDLPLHFGSTIVLRVDRTRPFVAQAVIFAPHNTPYDSGAFLFDIFFASEYPTEPPKVNLQTTGQGRVRFNPNLYQNGKVCLSLLGTWRGGATGSENWDSERSSLYQVLVSIQSAILGSEFPHFNEPSVEALWGTPEGDLQKRVNANGGYERLRVATIQHAMTSQLMAPPTGFEDAIKIHFRLKRQHIRKTVLGWIDEAKMSDTKGHLHQLSEAFNELNVLLECLQGETVPVSSTMSSPSEVVEGDEENMTKISFAEAVKKLKAVFPAVEEPMLVNSLKATCTKEGDLDIPAALQLLSAIATDS